MRWHPFMLELVQAMSGPKQMLARISESLGSRTGGRFIGEIIQTNVGDRVVITFVIREATRKKRWPICTIEVRQDIGSSCFENIMKLVECTDGQPGDFGRERMTELPAADVVRREIRPQQAIQDAATRMALLTGGLLRGEVIEHQLADRTVIGVDVEVLGEHRRVRLYEITIPKGLDEQITRVITNLLNDKEA